MTELYDESNFYTGPPLDESMVRRAEQDLGVRLPGRYVNALHQRNGGSLRNKCYPTDFPTSWASDHFEVKALLGIGGKWGIDSTSELGSSYLINEWGYPDIGIVICLTPSAGHDTVMLDYSTCGPCGEPTVTYIDEDRVPRQVSGSFGEFLDRLVPCDRFAH